MYRLTLGRRYLLMGILLFIASVYLGLNIPVSKSYLHINTVKTYTYIFVLLCTTAGISANLFIPSRHFKPLKEIITYVTICAVVVSTGFLYAFNTRANFDAAEDFMASQTTLYCKVASEPTLSNSGKSNVFYADVYMTSENKNVSKLKSPKRILVYTKYFEDRNHESCIPQIGDFLYVTHHNQLNTTVPTNGAFDYNRYLRQSEVVYSCYAHSVIQGIPQKDTGGFSALVKMGQGLRNLMSESTKAYEYAPQESALLKGIIMGDKDGFTEEDYLTLSKSGFMHIAAVSGMHISYLLLLLTALFGLIKIPRRFSTPLIILCLFIFAAASEFTPSVCRAVFMMSVALIAFAVRRSNDTLTTIGIAAAALILSNPYSIESISALLSFGATVGILVFYSPMRSTFNRCENGFKNIVNSMFNRIFTNITNKTITNKTKVYTDTDTDNTTNYKTSFIFKMLSKLKNTVINSLFISFAATVGIIYFMAKIFGTLQWGSIIRNIIVVPLTGIIFIAGAVNTALYQIIPFAAHLTGKLILNPALKLMNGIINFFSADVFSIELYVPSNSFFFVYIVLCISLYLLLEAPPKSKTKTNTEETNADDENRDNDNLNTAQTALK